MPVTVTDDRQIDSVISLFHTRDEVIGKKYMGAEGGFRTWLEAGMTAPAPSYLSKEDPEYYRQFFSPQNGGFEPSINWYKAQLADLNAKDDAGMPPLFPPPFLAARSDSKQIFQKRIIFSSSQLCYWAVKIISLPQPIFLTR